MQSDTVTLEPADQENVQILIDWTLDPVAQGPYKRVPVMSPEQLRSLFLEDTDRHYFIIRQTGTGKPLGRFYYRAWHFHQNHTLVDWELNIFIAEPAERGKGFGTAVQQMMADVLLQREETHSVFAYTFAINRAEQRALQKAGFKAAGYLPSAYYQIKGPPEQCVLYVRRKEN